MTLEQLLQKARMHLRDKAAPYMWTDEELTQFANIAVAEACARARLLQTALTIPVSVGQFIVDVPEILLYPDQGRFAQIRGLELPVTDIRPGNFYVIATEGDTDFTLTGAADSASGTFFRATAAGTGTGTVQEAPLHTVKFVSMQELYRLQMGFAPINGVPMYAAATGRSNQLELYPAPAYVGALLFEASRMPAATEELVNLSDVPVIPAQFHADLVHWMLYEAYRVDDADKAGITKARENEEIFTKRFGRRLSAKAEMFTQRAGVRRDTKVTPMADASVVCAEVRG